MKKLFEKGDCSGVKADHVFRLKIILQRLNAATKAEDMNTPGMRFHKLTGKLKDYYSVTVNRNWRVIFIFDGQDAILVDCRDYH